MMRLRQCRCTLPAPTRYAYATCFPHCVAAIMCHAFSPCARFALQPTAEQLTRAAGDGDVAALRGLLARSADVNGPDAFGDTALMWAAMTGQSGACTALLEAGADVSLSQSGWGKTSLDFAKTDGKDEAAAVLEAWIAAH